MPQMSPEEMQAMQQQANPQAGGDESGAISQKVQMVGQGLSDLIKVIASSQASTDQDKQNASAAMQAYMALVDGLGQESGQDPEAPQQADQGNIPADQGANGVPMGPQTRQ